MASPDTRSRVGFTAADRAFLLVVGSLLGLALGWVLPRLAERARDLPWVPFKGPLELVASWQGGWAPLAFLVLGAAAGVAFALYIVWESLQVTVGDDGVVVRSHGSEHSLARSEVSAVFLDGKELVLLANDTSELVRDEVEGKPPAVASAFTSHGYPWLDTDPHAAAYRRWVPDSPEVSGPANAVLAAREKALSKKDAEDATDLKAELAKIGYAVRDEGTRQYWRPLSL